MTLQPDEDRMIKLLEAMQRHGGSFASSLAEAWFRADSHNRKVLWDNFGDLLLSYQVFVKE